MSVTASQLVLAAEAAGEILVCDEGLSVWGGVDPGTSAIRDALHPQFGERLAGRIVMMPGSRGSCTGSGVLLGLALNGLAPAALVFREAESVLTLGALIADKMFGHKIAVLRLSDADYVALSQQSRAVVHPDHVVAGSLNLSLGSLDAGQLILNESDRHMLAGDEGQAVQLAMEVIVAMAVVQRADRLISVSRVHIDGCIYADPACLKFAKQMEAMGARVRVPTTLNAISVDHANWRSQGVDEAFGAPASQLADSYVAMGAQPSFTCAPYLLDNAPEQGESVAWAESNAVIYANSVLGARTTKHPDFLDMCIAITGRAPRSGVYSSANRAPDCIVTVTRPDSADDAFWPMLGWLLGEAAPDRIPLLRGLEHTSPSEDDLKALCAAFGTTSASPMLHIAGITPEADRVHAQNVEQLRIGSEDFARVWQQFNQGGQAIDLVALGSPHFSATESRAFLQALNGRKVNDAVTALITLGRETLGQLRRDGTEARLIEAGVTLVADLCWCSISEPVFPPTARVVLTNSGKYAHYGPGLSGREVRLGSLAVCADSAVSGLAPQKPPQWIAND